MNKTSTAVYMLIFVVILLLAFAMTKPTIAMSADGKTGKVTLWNFKKS